MLDTPCHYCSEHKALCHSSCEKYAEFKRLKELERQKERADSAKRNANYERMQRIKRGKRK